MVHLYTDGSLQHVREEQRASCAFVVIEQREDHCYNLVGFVGDNIATEESPAFIGIKEMDSSAGRSQALCMHFSGPYNTGHDK